MRGLLGDRFLRRFTGNLNHRRKHPDATGERENPAASVDAAPKLEAVRSDSHGSGQDREEAAAASAVADANGVPNKAEPGKQNETGTEMV